MVVISALRYDALELSPPLQKLLASKEFRRDAISLELNAGPPSLSVPQWLALGTGASPALTRVWGDRRLPETDLDSVFRQARLHGLSSFVSGSPWFTEIYHSQLLKSERFYAEGAVPPTYAAADSAAAAAGAAHGADVDRQRLRLLRRAMAATQPGGEVEGGRPRRLFELMVAQLSEADVQSSCGGATAAFNAKGSYASAIANTTAALTELVAELDSTTTLLITSDHGAVDRGGSGGAEPNSVSIPLIAYRAGSNLGVNTNGRPFSAAPRFNGVTPSTEDVAVTVAALLGVPAPRQSEGVFVDALMPLANQPMLSLHYKDLYLQRQALVAALAAALGVPLTASDAALVGAPPPTELTALRDGVTNLQALGSDVRRRALASSSRAAVAATLGYALLVVALLAVAVRRGSFADPWLVLKPKAGEYANRRAFVFAFVGSVSYYAASLALVWLLLRLRGFSALDSTATQSPAGALIYLTDVALPSLVSAYVVARAFHFPYLVVAPPPAAAAEAAALGAAKNPHKPPAWIRAYGVVSQWVRCLFLGDAPVYSDVAMLYLCKVYLLCFAVLAALALCVAQAASYTFVVPPLLTVHFDPSDPSAWTYRFSLITLQLVAVVHVGTSALLLRLWPSANLANAHYDKLYSLALLKHERVHGSSSKGDDVIGMLEEETEALIQKRYVPHHREDDD